MAAVGDLRQHYIKWFGECLESTRIVQKEQLPLCKIQAIAKDFSLLISPPPEVHGFVYQIADEEGFLEEVNRTAQFFKEFREDLPSAHHVRKILEWYSFEPLTEVRWKQELSAFPLVMTEQRFKVVEDGSRLQAYWNHLMTCLCSAASPKGIDGLATQIAQDLEGKEHALLIDFGAGGCLPVLPIVSRLTHMKQIFLFLVDPIYPKDEHRIFMVKHHCVAAKDGGRPSARTKTSLAIMELLGNCAKYFPEGSECSLYVYVMGSVDQLVHEKLAREHMDMPHVLFAVDPMPEAAADFRKAVGAIQDSKPLCYCLNEVAGVTGKLTVEEALDTDRIFSRTLAE